jgi:hypothetical protein
MADKTYTDTDEHVEGDITKQNPATERLVEEMDQAFDVMAENLIKQVEKLLANED